MSIALVVLALTGCMPREQAGLMVVAWSSSGEATAEFAVCAGEYVVAAGVYATSGAGVSVQRYSEQPSAATRAAPDYLVLALNDAAIDTATVAQGLELEVDELPDGSRNLASTDFVYYTSSSREHAAVDLASVPFREDGVWIVSGAETANLEQTVLFVSASEAEAQLHSFCS